MRANIKRIVTLVAGAALLGGCSTFYTPFAFPPEEGNIEAGQQAFVDHHCHQCHSVAGVRLPDLAGAPDPIFELGGETSTLKSYAELVTSVVNPNHIVSEQYREQLRLQGQVPMNSPMPAPDLDRMTVRQLFDIVAFLDSRYELVEDYESYEE